jgi:hypothetical protein
MTVEYIHNHVHTAWGLRVFAVVEAERFTAAICALAGARLTNFGRAIYTAIDRGTLFGVEACGFVCIVIFTSGGRLNVGRLNTVGGNAGSSVAGEAVATVLIELTEAAFLANSFVAAVTARETLRVGFTNNGRWLVSGFAIGSLTIGALTIGSLTVGSLTVASVLGAVICPTAIRLIRICLFFKVEMAAGKTQRAKGEGGEQEEVAEHGPSVRHHRGLLATNCPQARFRTRRRALVLAGAVC